MDITQSVIEAHLSTGKASKTIPLRQAIAKSGNVYFATLKQKADGSRVDTPYGVNVPVALTGNPNDIDTITVDGVGEVKVTHDVTEPYVKKLASGKTKVTPGGKARAMAEEEFSVKGEKWVFTFRATLVSADVVNVKATIRRQGGANGSNVQIQSSL